MFHTSFQEKLFIDFHLLRLCINSFQDFILTVLPENDFNEINDGHDRKLTSFKQISIKRVHFFSNQPNLTLPVNLRPSLTVVYTKRIFKQV